MSVLVTARKAFREHSIPCDRTLTKVGPVCSVNIYLKSSEKAKTVEARVPVGREIETTHLALAMGSMPLSLTFLSL